MNHYLIRRGMGEGPGGAGIALSTASGTNLESGYPGYCSWLPFADFMSACKVPTIAQIQQQSLSNLTSNVPPEAVSSTLADMQAADAADCAANPDLCGQFTFAGSNPLTAATFGAGPVGQAAGGLEAAIGTVGGALSPLASLFASQWTWIALGVVALIYFAPRGGR